MEKEKIQELIAKYNEGLADPSEIKLIEQLIEKGNVDLEQFEGLTAVDSMVMKMTSPLPTTELDDRFYQMLAQQKKRGKRFSWLTSFSWPELAPRLALASLTLILGFAGGFWWRSGSTPEVTELSQQVSDLKEMMMLSLLEKESASERLRAVSLTEEFDQASNKVMEALFETLNHDSNVNVRLAALEALKPYVRNNAVREELVRSIAKQESPLVQVALAELMVALQEKSSVKELQKIVEDENTPSDVKKKIEESIKVMI